jgi:hypothetical protein
MRCALSLPFGGLQSDIPQFPLQNLTRRAFGEVIHQSILFRNLERREARLEIGTQFVFVEILAGTLDDEGSYPFAPFPVRQSYDGALLHLLSGEEDLLHFLGIDVLPSRADDCLNASGPAQWFQVIQLPLKSKKNPTPGMTHQKLQFVFLEKA